VPDTRQEPSRRPSTTLPAGTAHNPGDIEGDLPLNREARRHLAQSVLGWTADPGFCPAQLQKIALQLSNAARALADDVRHAADQLHDDHPARALTDVVLTEASRRLAAGPQGTVRSVQGRARLVRALAERLDRLDAALAPEKIASSGD
jgi:hypothetical protein